MTKHLLISLLLTGFLALSGCMSKKSEMMNSGEESLTPEELYDGEAGQGDVAGESLDDMDEEDDDLNLDDVEEEFPEDFADENGVEEEFPEDFADENGVEEEFPEDFADESGVEEEFPEDFADESSAEEEFSGVLADEGGTEEEFPEVFADQEPAPDIVDNYEQSSQGEMVVEEPVQETPPVRRWVPVKKIAQEAFRKNGYLVNAVYIARPGDTVESVSQKIFGSTQGAADILAINPNLHKGVKTGDKLYYNSPSRGNDASRLLFYYEEIGLQPETYISKEGDNIRKISQQLLGDEHSWKEVWATNFQVNSKWRIPAGLSLRYWTGVSGFVPAPAANLALQETPKSLPPQEQSPPSFEGDVVPPPGGGDHLAQNIPSQTSPEGGFPDMSLPPDEGMEIPEDDLPPPPPVDEGMEEGLPPPPPIEDSFANNEALAEPQLAANVEPVKKEPQGKVGKAASQGTMTLALQAAVLLLVVGLVIIIVILRKRRSRKAFQEFADSQTQTETRIE